jgi:putative redox protein
MIRRNDLTDPTGPVMKATARQTGTTFAHRVAIRHHELIVDEPPELGGEDQGPNPQELLAASIAACTAITVEMYARRKDWDIGPVEVHCEYATADRGEPTVFDLVLRLPTTCSEEQVEKLSAIAAKCPVHRTLDGEIVFRERVEQRPPDEAT